MSESDDDPEIRTFAAPDEIWNLEGFRPDNPVNNDNYARVIGDYWFPDEVKCCRQKENGNLCNEEHKWGFVAKLIDGTVTIVGNSCAINKFGADSKLKADRSRYINEKRRREAYAHLEDLVASKAQKLENVQRALTEVNELSEQVSSFTSRLSDETLRSLQAMYRIGASSVSVRGISYRKYTDEEGIDRQERTVTDHAIGRIDGLSCLNKSTFSSIRNDAAAAEAAFEQAEQLESSSTISEIKDVISGLRVPDRVEEAVDSLRSEVDRLMRNDWLTVCFVTGNKSERYRLAQFALEQRGESCGKDKAKNWLAEQEAEIAKSLGVDKVELK